MKVYLAGAIEHAPDGGKGWRKEIGDFIREELGHDVYDPSVSELTSLKDEEKETLKNSKVNDTDAFREVIRKIIHYDVDILLKESDYIVCLWDEYTAIGGGTHGELTLAYLNDKPVYMVCGMSLKRISGWIVGCTTKTFDDFGGLKDFLKKEYT